MFFPTAIPKKRYWTLFIRPNALIIAKLEGSSKKLAVYEEFPLPDGILVRNEIKDPEKLVGILSQIKEKLKIIDKFVVVGIPEDQCLNHTLILPPLSSKEIGEAVAYQADTFLPFPYQKECVDWMLIKTMSDGKKKVLVSAIPKNIIDGYISVLEKVSLHPIAFESTSLSLFRLIPPTERKLSLALNISNINAVLLLLKDDSILTSSLVYDQKDTLSIIKKVLDYYLSEKDRKENDLKIFTCGQNLSQEITTQIGTLGLKIVNLSVNTKVYPTSKDNNQILLSSLLNKTVEPPHDEKTINIIPENQLEKYDSIFKERGGKKIITILLFLVIFLNLIMAFAYYRLNLNIYELKKSLTLTEKELNSLDTIKNLNSRSQIIKKSAFQEKLFSEVSNLIKENSSLVNITNISYSQLNKELVLSGTTKTRDNLFRFKEILEKKALFLKVQIPASSLEKDNNLDFRIIGKL